MFSEQLALTPRAVPVSDVKTARYYQDDAVDAVAQSIAAGRFRHLVSMPTGTGKATVAALFPERLGFKRTLVLVHRKALVNQLADTFREWNPGMRVEVEQAERKAGAWSDVVVASIPSVSRKNVLGDYKRLARIGDFDAVIHDEVHVCSAGALKLYEELKAGQSDGPHLIGLTATPWRTSDENFIFEMFGGGPVYSKDILWGWQEGWLSPGKALRITTDTDLSNVHTKLGDFNEKELSAAANTEYRNAEICRAIEEHAADRNHILVFCVNVSHAAALTGQLCKRGHDAEMVIGETDDEDRAGIFGRFTKGRTRILCGVDVFSVGFDEPKVDCIVHARPTKSKLWYVQATGRGFRKHASKVDCLILDVVDNTGRHDVMTLATMMGLPEMDLEGLPILEALERFKPVKKYAKKGAKITELETVVAEANAREAKRLANLRIKAEEVSLAQKTQQEKNVSRETPFDWVPLTPSYWALHLEHNERIEMRRLGDHWTIQHLKGGQQVNYTTAKADMAPLATADNFIKRSLGKKQVGTPDRPFWVQRWLHYSRDVKWKQKPVCEASLRTLKGLGGVPVNGMTEGAARTAITNLMERKRFRRETEGVRMPVTVRSRLADSLDYTQKMMRGEA